jgi:poly(A) polymerase
VRNVFGRRKTLAVGAAFGVITVLGPRGESGDAGSGSALARGPAGQVEVATFRVDAPSTDGRHPAGVTFCSAREDAQRRDFTINGLFLDPLTGAVHDYVGGRADLAAGIVRAIGVPAQRFAEDHLRMLRAIRFTAFFGFVLEEETRAALERMTRLVTTVSPERVAAELRAMVSRPGRRQALELLADTGLAAEVLGEVAGGPTAGGGRVPPHWGESAANVAALDEPDLPLALAVLAEGSSGGVDVIERIARRLRLSNREAKGARWLTTAVAELGGLTHAEITSLPLSRVQPWLAHEHAACLADLLRARASAGRGAGEAAAWVTTEAARPRAELDPPPLVTGSDLLAAGVAAGPALGRALARIRALQLDGEIATREEALAAARE